MTTDKTYLTTSESVKVTAVPTFMPEQTLVAQSLYFWSYSVTIENFSEFPVQLLKRYWKVIDANGDLTEIRGAGVVGQTPLISPHDLYNYSSGTYMKTPSGMMMGYYTMRNAITDQQFDVEIPAFSLDSPYEAHTPS